MGKKTQEARSAPKKADLEQVLDAASLPFVGQWNKLVTTTNWEKGRIIQEWREAMRDSGAAVTEFSDEAWARRVSGVTGQHVGRLRRVYQKFGAARRQYEGLYWSHFQAALDWEEPESWLVQAVQRAWSVAQMRTARWESLGVPPDQRPPEEAIEADLDEDFEPALREKPLAEGLTPSRERARSAGEPGPSIEGPDFGDEEDQDDSPPGSSGESSRFDADDEAVSAPPARPFQEIGSLPDDVVEAFEGYKLAILRHKREGWLAISINEMLATLDSLKELALAPIVETAAF
jgi:hypothetical protein